MHLHSSFTYMILIHQIHVFELVIGIYVYNPCRLFFFLLYLSSRKKSLKHSGPNRDLNPDLCDGGVVFYRLSFQANWELVVMWVNESFFRN